MEDGAGWSGARRRHLRPGQVLSHPLRPDNQVFVVCSGRLRVHLSDERRELTLAFLGPEDLYATHTPAWVTAVTASEVLLVGAREFSVFLQREPAATGWVMRALGSVLGDTIRVVENLVFRDVNERLAHFLAASTRRHGQRSADGWVLRLELTVTEIALLLGSTRQSVSSALSAMAREGLVRREGRRQLLVPDLEALAAWRMPAKQVRACKQPDVGQPTDPMRRAP